jgi:hypothetical protein
MKTKWRARCLRCSGPRHGPWRPNSTDPRWRWYCRNCAAELARRVGEVLGQLGLPGVG